MSKVIFDKPNVLVAGGAGFIGSHLCEELVKDCKVICVDNFISSAERNIEHLLPHPNFVFINHDLTQPLDLADRLELKKFKIDFQGLQEIYNLACPMSAKNFLANRVATLEANSVVMKNLLDLAVKYETKFLQFSSSVVYGPQRSGEIIAESNWGSVDFLSERACYDEGKRFAETIVRTYQTAYNLNAKIIRVFRTYGPRMPLNDDQMIPDFVNCALDGTDLTILGDENFASSFCYVGDVVDAAIKMMQSNLSGPINIGSDEEIKIVEIAKMIIAATESPSKIVWGEKQLFMTELPRPDITKARNDLGWMPVVTLNNGLDKTIFDLQAKRQLKGLS